MTAHSPAAFSKYFTYSERDEAWGVYCTTVGQQRVPPGGPYPFMPDLHPPEYLKGLQRGSGTRRVLHEYVLLYVTRGQGTFLAEGRAPERVGPGTVIVLFPGVPHWYAPDTATGWDEYWVGFRGTQADRLAANGFLSRQHPVFPLGYLDLVLHHFLELVEIAKVEPPYFQQKMGALVLNLLADVLSCSHQQAFDSEAEEMVRRARFDLEEHVLDSVDINELSRRLGTTYSVLRKTFKEYTGLSPYQFYLHLKVNLAKRLLQEGRLSVKEVAYELGFDNPYYFSRLFKSKTGLPPSEWYNGGRQEVQEAQKVNAVRNS
jgi:AraC-like DNA-binding protein